MPEALMGRKAAGYRQGYAKGVQQGLRKGMQKGIKEGLLRDAILGTTAERLVARCECPILVVHRAPQEEYRKLSAAQRLAVHRDRGHQPGEGAPLLATLPARARERGLTLIHRTPRLSENVADRLASRASWNDRFRRRRCTAASGRIRSLPTRLD
jgi:hypothetical protein